MSRLLKTYNKSAATEIKTPPLGGVFFEWLDFFDDIIDVIDEMSLFICSGHGVGLHFADKIVSLIQARGGSLVLMTGLALKYISKP